MEIVQVVRALWRRRLALTLGLLAAAGVGIARGGTPPASSGVAFVRVALDTPRSQLLTPAPTGVGTLPWRASLLSHLVASDPVKQQVARKAGIRLEQLAVVDPALTVPAVPASLPKSAAAVAAIDPAPYVLTVYLSNGALPIISIGTNAPDRRAATRLAAAAAGVLEADASSARLPGLQRFVVQRVTPIHARTLVTKSPPTKSAAIAFVLFAMWCACVALAARFRIGGFRLRRSRPT
jgi:hypothetical protein